MVDDKHFITAGHIGYSYFCQGLQKINNSVDSKLYFFNLQSINGIYL